MADPSPSLDELTTPCTWREVETTLYRVMAAVGMKTSSWRPNAVVRAIVVAVAVFVAALTVLAAEVAAGGFLETARGSWKKLVAWFTFDTAALKASFAAGSVTITNTGTSVYDEAAGDVAVLGPDDQVYVSLEAMVIGPGGSITLNVRAKEAGSAGSCGASTITRFEGTYPGLTVTNPSAFVGTDDETDSELERRAKSSAAAISPNGPVDAYEAVALAATRADGTHLGVNRVRVVQGPGDGSCTVYAATASGAVAGDVEDPETDLGRLHYLLNTLACPPQGTTTAASGIGLTISVIYRVWVYTSAGLSAAQIVAAVDAALTAYLRQLPIGGDWPSDAAGYVFVDMLRKVILSAVPGAFHCEITSPAADVECERYSVPQVGTLTGTATLVRP